MYMGLRSQAGSAGSSQESPKLEGPLPLSTTLGLFWSDHDRGGKAASCLGSQFQAFNKRLVAPARYLSHKFEVSPLDGKP